MPAVSENDLTKAIKSGELLSAYYFYGKDVFAVETFAKKVLDKALGKADRTYNLHKFEGKNFSTSAFADCVEALPVFAEKLCVLVNDLNADEMNKDDLDYLVKTIENLPESTVVIFYITGIDLFGGKKYVSEKNKKIISAVSKKGAVCEFSYKKPQELAKMIEDKAKSLGSMISKENAVYLAELCLCDAALVNNEIEKLAAYADGKEISREMMDMLVSKQLESSAFSLAKALAFGNIRQAFAILDVLFAQKTEPALIIGALSSSFADLYRAKTALGERVSQQEVMDDFGYPQNRSFGVRNAFEDAKRVQIAHLRRCLEILSRVDREIKSVQIPQRLLIEKAFAEMAAGR